MEVYIIKAAVVLGMIFASYLAIYGAVYAATDAFYCAKFDRIRAYQREMNGEEDKENAVEQE
jgi:hypothetical protein